MKNKFLLATVAGISLIAISEAGCKSCGNVNRSQHSSQGRSNQYNTMHRYNSFSHQGQEDRYITENDRQVLNQIRQILSEDQYSDLNIHATVEYGKVVLDGKTYSQGVKDDIQQQVAGLQGVRHVIMDVYVDNRERKNPNGSHSKNQQNGSQNNGSRSWWQSDKDNRSNLKNGDNDKGGDSPDSNRGRQNGWNKDTPKNGQSNGYDGQSYRQQNRNNSQPYYYEDYQTENGSMNQNEYSNRQVSDSQLKSQIEKMLIGGWFSKSQTGVKVDVNNGIVTLSGQVDSQMDKRTIANEIENMDGVRRVYNRVEIKQQGGKSRQEMNSPRNSYNNYRR